MARAEQGSREPVEGQHRERRGKEQIEAVPALAEELQEEEEIEARNQVSMPSRKPCITGLLAGVPNQAEEQPGEAAQGDEASNGCQIGVRYHDEVDEHEHAVGGHATKQNALQKSSRTRLSRYERTSRNAQVALVRAQTTYTASAIRPAFLEPERLREAANRHVWPRKMAVITAVRFLASASGEIHRSLLELGTARRKPKTVPVLCEQSAIVQVLECLLHARWR